MTDDILLQHTDGAITTLTLNAPATINALSTAMLTRLDAALDSIATSSARVVILRGAGKNFCAGHDLREIQSCRSAADHGASAFAALFTLCSAVMQKIATLPQPVIAEVQGIATAAGCQLAASCDMVVAAETARFGVNGVNIGLFCHTPLVALSAKIAPAQAFELAATGEFISAARAQSLGLVTRLAPPDALQDTTRALAEQLAGKLPVALAMGKRAAARPLADAYAKATMAMVENLLTPETDEGIAAFLEKRAPNWPV
jgi:enoyl-CoA hydratase/carnithine racemase